MSSACFEQPSVHPQEDLYMQFYGISFMYPYKHTYKDAGKKYSNTACTSLSEDEHLRILDARRRNYN